AQPAIPASQCRWTVDDPYLLALSALAQSARPGASPDQRAGCLRACLLASDAALRARATAPRLILAARIARELGMTARASQLASQLATGAMRGGRMDIDGSPHAVLSNGKDSFEVAPPRVLDGNWRVEVLNDAGLQMTWIPSGQKISVGFAR
ncbi:MAG: hypothetical protein EBS99_17190, partial [Betaproteobacteria bacterium]|nr:hypothetical protein [Betaproteobacteria bacterium]